MARRRAPRSSELVLVAGGAATLVEESVAREPTWVVVLDAEERRGSSAGARTFARWASAIEPDWLLDLFPDEVADETQFEWDAAKARVEVVSRLAYGPLALTETRRSPAENERAQAGELVLEAARAAGGLGAFVDRDAFESLAGRLGFLSDALPDAALPKPNAPFFDGVLVRAASSKTSFQELEAEDLLGTLIGALSPAAASLLARHAPERIALPSGRSVKVNYEPGKPPWVASRLQDFFGTLETPRLGAGRVPVVVHLLAPNQRAVQVTQDLAGFWSRHYPDLRRQLMRRYPRHEWPEDPARAAPSAGPRPRRRPTQ